RMAHRVGAGKGTFSALPHRPFAISIERMRHFRARLPSRIASSTSRPALNRIAGRDIAVCCFRRRERHNYQFAMDTLPENEKGREGPGPSSLTLAPSKAGQRSSVGVERWEGLESNSRLALFGLPVEWLKARFGVFLSSPSAAIGCSAC